MRQKRLATLSLLLAVTLGVTVYAAGGTASDPLVSLSYLNTIFTTKVEARLAEAVAELDKMSVDGVTDGLTAHLQSRLNAAVAEKVAARVSAKVAASGSLNMGAMTRLTLAQGDRVVGLAGTGVVLESGAAELYGSQASEILDLTQGAARRPGPAAAQGYYYMLTAPDGSGLRITSATAQVLVRDGAQVLPAYTPIYSARADALKQAGLFVGTDNGYELDRPPTRQEALIMLVRLLGEESAALAYTGTTTFKDLTGWADGQRYIVYAHNKGYTTGESATAFAQYKFATLEMVLTFTLRALGYSDAAGDFVWNTTSRDLAVSLGLLGQSVLDSVASTGFTRDHVVLISANALGVSLKGESRTLGQKLVAAGILTSEQLAAIAAAR